MRFVLASLLALAMGLSACAHAPDAADACAWDGGEWTTRWAVPGGDFAVDQPLQIILGDDEAVTGAWGAPSAGGWIAGRFADEDQSRLVGTWGIDWNPGQPAGSFELRRAASEHDCRFTGFYALGEGSERLEWSGWRARDS